MQLKSLYGRFYGNCGETVNQLLLEDILAEIEVEYRSSEENDRFLDNNDISMAHISLLYEKAKRIT